MTSLMISFQHGRDLVDEFLMLFASFRGWMLEGGAMDDAGGNSAGSRVVIVRATWVSSVDSVGEWR